MCESFYRRWAACALVVAACGGSADAARPAPDLVEVRAIAVQQGVAVVVTDVVRNAGSAAARRSWTAVYAGGTRVGGRWVAALRAGAASRGVVRLALGPGTYRVRVCADALHAVAEVREANNCRAAAGAVVVRDVRPPVFAGLESAVTCIPGPAGGPTRSSSYRLEWKAASDDGTPAAGIVYDVYQANAVDGEDFAAPTYTSEPGATSFSTPPLPDDRAYFFVVRARDRAGNEERNRAEERGTNLCV